MRDQPDRIPLTPGNLSLASLRRVAEGNAVATLDTAAEPAVTAGASFVAEICRGDDAVYGVNTGFGKLARTRVPGDRLAELQANLVCSHAAGVGDPLPAPVVRLVLTLKLNALAQGYSGVRWALLQYLEALLAADILPEMPARGSVGASGDLAPLAHMSLVLIGRGHAWHGDERLDGAVALARAGLSPITLAPKEGLALLNGTQVSTALALQGLFRAENALAATIVAGAMATDAAKASAVPFEAVIQNARGQPGQSALAAVYAELLADSGILASHRNCGKVQDPYSLRCQPQVMGPVLDALTAAAETLMTEANAVSDNPLVLPEARRVLSGGNFHGAPVAHAADRLTAALADMAVMSERRINLLTDANLSDGLPAFLVPEPGLNSGFMMAQVTAAALAAECRQRSQPVAVQSIPTSAGQEDHVPMATFAARRLADQAGDAARVAAIELLAGAQGIELRRPLTSSPALEGYVGEVRRAADFLDRDRELAPAIAATWELVMAGAFRAPVAQHLPSQDGR